MISRINIRIVVENGDGIQPKDLCIPFDAQVRPYAGEYVSTKDGTRKFLVVRGEWCRLFEDKDIYGFLLTLREKEK